MGGYWYVKDLNSRNGVKVNAVRTTDKRMDPGDVLAVAKHNYTVRYSPIDNGAVGPPPLETPEESVFRKTLLERAGLIKGKRHLREMDQDDSDLGYDITKDLPDSTGS